MTSEPLLGNPQFLQLFADAFIEGGRVFKNKRSIFEDAVKRLAHVAAGGVPQKNAPFVEEIIELANEVFAKLLLSGAVGLSIIDALDDRQFPRLASIVKRNAGQSAAILDTRLLKPSDNANQHEPVHRIVAEYCAARYLSRRIDDSSTLFRLCNAWQ